MFLYTHEYIQNKLKEDSYPLQKLLQTVFGNYPKMVVVIVLIVIHCLLKVMLMRDVCHVITFYFVFHLVFQCKSCVHYVPMRRFNCFVLGRAIIIHKFSFSNASEFQCIAKISLFLSTKF